MQCDRNATSVGNNDAQPLTWDVVNLGVSELRESIPLRELDAHFPLYCKPEREFNFFKLFLVDQVPEAFFSVHEGVCDRRPNLEPQYMVNISSFKIELGLVGKCVNHSFRIYMGCYLQFCITKSYGQKTKTRQSALFPHTYR